MLLEISKQIYFNKSTMTFIRSLYTSGYHSIVYSDLSTNYFDFSKKKFFIPMDPFGFDSGTILTTWTANIP